MVGENAADIPEVAPGPHVGSLVFASDMVVERGVRLMAAHVVLRGRLVCASLMVEDAVVISLAVTRVLRGVPCTVKHMVEESDAYLLAALKVQKAIHLSAKGTVEGSAACLIVVEYAQKVCTEVQISALHMAEGRGVLSRAVARAPVAGQIVV